MRNTLKNALFHYNRPALQDRIRRWRRSVSLKTEIMPFERNLTGSLGREHIPTAYLRLVGFDQVSLSFSVLSLVLPPLQYLKVPPQSFGTLWKSAGPYKTMLSISKKSNCNFDWFYMKK